VRTLKEATHVEAPVDAGSVHLVLPLLLAAGGDVVVQIAIFNQDDAIAVVLVDYVELIPTVGLRVLRKRNRPWPALEDAVEGHDTVDIQTSTHHLEHRGSSKAIAYRRRPFLIDSRVIPPGL